MVAELGPDPDREDVIAPALAAYRDNAHQSFVPPPVATVVGRAQQRASRRVVAAAVAAAAAAVLAGGVAVAVNLDGRVPPPPGDVASVTPTPRLTPSPPATPTGSASASPSPRSTSSPTPPQPSKSATRAPSIPASTALLQPADVGGAKPRPLDKGEFAHVRPLRPCGDDRYPSDASRRDAVAVSYFLDPAGSRESPSVAVQFVGVHAPGGAAEQFDDVREALRRCPGGLGQGQRRWTVLGSDLAGDESVLVRIDQRFVYGSGNPITVSHYSALARVGDVIVVVTDLGWEVGSGSEELVRDLIGKAVQRARTID
jgi:hypothetical protein